MCLTSYISEFANSVNVLTVERRIGALFLTGVEGFDTPLLAGMEGFEPPNARTKTWCLTTWPHPNELPEVVYR